MCKKFIGVNLGVGFKITLQEINSSSIDHMRHKKSDSLRTMSELLLTKDIFIEVEQSNPTYKEFEARLTVIDTDEYRQTIQQAHQMMKNLRLTEEQAYSISNLFYNLATNHE